MTSSLSSPTLAGSSEDEYLPFEVRQAERLISVRLQVRGIGALSDPEVARVLGLSDNQRTEIESIARERNRSIQREIHAAREAGRRISLQETMQKLRFEAEQRVLEVLTEEQRFRFAKLSRRASAGVLRRVVSI